MARLRTLKLNGQGQGQQGHTRWCTMPVADCHRSPSCAAGRDTQLSSQRRRLIVSPLRNRFVPLRRRNISSTKMASPCKSNHPNIVTSCKHGSDCVALGRVDDNPDSLLDRYCDCEASEILVAGIECEVSRPSTLDSQEPLRLPTSLDHPAPLSIR